MANTATQPNTVPDFLTPARILIPKLVRSRDGWKAKAAARKKQYRKERIRSRDLTLSRQRWKERTLLAQQHAQQLQLQLDAAQAELQQLRLRQTQLEDDAKKN